MQKTMAREGTEDREFFIYSLIYSNKLAYLQLITVLVCRNSPLKSESSKDTCEDIFIVTNVYCPCLKNGNGVWIIGRHLDYC